jgi:hypothetical protein
LVVPSDDWAAIHGRGGFLHVLSGISLRTLRFRLNRRVRRELAESADKSGRYSDFKLFGRAFRFVVTLVISSENYSVASISPATQEVLPSPFY